MPWKIRRIRPLIFVGILYVLQSCKPLYLPNPANVPMLTTEGEFNAQLSVGTSFLDGQFAFSPLDHFGVMANVSGHNSGPNSNHFLVEGGAGYYGSPDSGKLVLDFYGGFGIGSTRAQETSLGTTTTAKGNFLRAFVQPSIGFCSSIVDANFCIKGSFISMQEYVPVNSTVFTRHNNFFVEPLFTTKVGWKYFKVFGQIGFSIPMVPLEFEYNPFLINLGFNINIGKAWGAENEF